MISPAEAVTAWRRFASELRVGDRTWHEYLSSYLPGRADELTVVQPLAFPRFAQDLLGFEIGVTLAPERHGVEGVPDFTPADAVTHPFVFETKGTMEGTALGFEQQVERYLTLGRPRIRMVVLTNLVGVKVFELVADGSLTVTLAVDLRGLLEGSFDGAVATQEATRLASFLERFSYQSLTPAEKLSRIRSSPPWSPFEVTNADWLSNRIDRVVTRLDRDVEAMVEAGVLGDRARVAEDEADRIADELRHLAWRLGMPIDATGSLSLDDFLKARQGSVPDKALQQYVAHVAYYAATRLVLVRTWEDLGLIRSALYDGPFDELMKALDGVISDVVAHSFNQALRKYRSLFDSRNNYTWYSPSEETYAEVLYELANTYFGEVRSDVLGRVYERLLARVDRKALGQYYTPRDVIALIWDLVASDAELVAFAEEQRRLPRVLDIATGSGGFLVDIARRLTDRLAQQVAAGASITLQDWLNAVSDGLNGVEIQPFPSYLAELNLLIQLSDVLARDTDLRVPSLGIVAADTLSLHNPSDRLLEEGVAETPSDLSIDSAEKRARAERVKGAADAEYLMDVACGNPPYVGEKLAAPVLRATRERFPYWEQFTGPHLDYLYWFLILGVSKLRTGGRFGFITTEYWLRSAGARALREYLAQRCHIERILLFRNMRLFPDAPGQHSMVIVGTRVAPPDQELAAPPPVKRAFPIVSVYEGPPLAADERAPVLEAMRTASRGAGVNRFTAKVSPNDRAGDSWSEVVLSPSQLTRRQALRANAQPIDIDTDEGVLTSADRMRAGKDAQLLPTGTLEAIGWPERRQGIFVLTPDEVASLGGTMTQQERGALRTVINTKDVLPYAAVPQRDAETMIYLPYPETPNRATLPFPDDMPTLQRHLEMFRPLLEDKIARYGENRPWWSLHRPRAELIALPEWEGWAGYCATPRWGPGQRLVVGLLPGGSVPQSGLHALIPPSGVPAAYLCGLFNSTAVQDLAETLPPGNVTAEDVKELGLPLLPDQVAVIANIVHRLAHAVSEMAMDLAERFPHLPGALCDDLTLDSVPSEAWLPAVGSPTQWGELRNVQWVQDIRKKGPQTAAIATVEVHHSLLGAEVFAASRQGASLAVTLEGYDEELAHSLAAYIRGAAFSRQLRHIPTLDVPTDRTALPGAMADDLALLLSRVEHYRALRMNIDEVVEAAI